MTHVKWRVFSEVWISALPHGLNIYNHLSLRLPIETWLYSHGGRVEIIRQRTWGCHGDSTLTWRVPSTCLQGRLYFQCGLIPLEEQTKRDSWAKFFHALNFRVDQETIPHVQLCNVPTKRLVVVVAPVGLLVLSNHEKAIASNVTGWVEGIPRTHNHSIHPDDPLPGITIPTGAYKVPGGIIGKASYVGGVWTMHQQCKVDRFVPGYLCLELEFFNERLNGIWEDCGKSMASGIKLEVSANRKHFHVRELVMEASRFPVWTHWKFQHVCVLRTWKTTCNVY